MNKAREAIVAYIEGRISRTELDIYEKHIGFKK